MCKLGYLRISTQEQRPDRQIDGLKEICDELFIEQASGASLKRPIYERVISKLRPGDGMVVWSLDRAYRSTVDAILEVERLKELGVALEIVDLKVDTATPQGMLIFSVIAAFAEFERRTISQRTKEGLASARTRGVRLGRPPKLSMKQLDDALIAIRSGSPMNKVASAFDVTPCTLSRAIKRNGLSSL